MKPVGESSMLTDGYFLLYNPKHVLSNFKHQKETVVRDYLHIVLHCIYRHMFVDPSLDRPLWDLACDIAVENVVTDLGLKAAASFREGLQATMPPLTPLIFAKSSNRSGWAMKGPQV